MGKKKVVLRPLFRISVFNNNKSRKFLCPFCAKVKHPIINRESVWITRGKNSMLEIKSEKWGTTQYSILVESIKQKWC